LISRSGSANSLGQFLGIWEGLNNPGFKPVEFDGFRKSAGLNSFALTPRQWIEKTGAVGLLSIIRRAVASLGPCRCLAKVNIGGPPVEGPAALNSGPVQMRTRSLVRHVIVALALVAASTGCSSPTSPDQLSELTFQAALLGSSGAPAGATFPPTVVADGKGIVVLGIIGTPDPCYATSGSGSRVGNQVTIKVTARPVGQGCILITGEFAYRAVTPLASGIYRVEVVHEYSGSGPPAEVVLKVTIQVQ
jgi:hypothetical protein